ncbi:disease resistance protein RML1B-like [Pistacia vera]|uniref:disease resistance protein RML1B-like n=1 Tax=Pistacia vera TaxID=55513 RepID=UPI0012631647|nr:disease resistance protein RML1B-like [Pistacia vera]
MFQESDFIREVASCLEDSLITWPNDTWKDSLLKSNYDKELKRGYPIRPELLQAIEESKISIIILSQNYAFSTWCLDELTKIVQCMDSWGHMVIPIFYDVDPSVVRKQIGNFNEAFAGHEDTFKEDVGKVQTWRRALTKVANLCGWDAKNRYESELIKDIVKEILNKINTSASVNIKNLVGINSRLGSIRNLIGTEPDVRMIGIFGMAGIGKTTIARAIYMSISSEFEGNCFLANVGEISDKYDGLVSLQRYESELIKDIVKEILNKINTSASVNIKNLVGINSRLGSIRNLIGTEPDVRMIGIFGMAGIGKTTIARAVYMSISSEFEGNCFLANVGEISDKYDGLVSLQRQLLCQILREKERKISIWDIDMGICEIKNRLQHRKVLVVIDDVTHINQLEFLAGESTWFGLGSRIIITTRNKHLLKIQRVNETYEAEELNHDEAVQLLSLKAFKDHQPSEGYQELSNRVVSYASGNPLALEVLGSFLFGRTMDEWKDALKRLSKDSNKEILDRLQISFNGLEESEKKIFLDIACFFKGHDRDYVTRILDGSGFYPIIGINCLIEKCLITVSTNNQLWMHDLLQEMGRQIVKKECPNEPGQRSRLWEEADIRHVLTKNTGSERVEGIMVDKELNLSASAKAFSNMINLRLLKIHNVQLPEGIEYLSHKLLILEWHGYPLKSLLLPNLQFDEIIELDMSNSSIEHLWEGSQNLEKLNSINLRNCRKLTKTPDFIGISNLEKVILEGCIMLREIHPSLFVHKNIIVLSLRNCINLTFPSKIYMESLQLLDLSGCFQLQSSEEESLERKFNIGRDATRKLKIMKSPLLIVEILKNLFSHGYRGPSLSRQNPRWYSRLIAGWMPRRSSNALNCRLPSLLGCHSLTDLNLSDCNLREDALPKKFWDLRGLRSLDLSRNNFVSLPESISRLSMIDTFSLEGCKNLQSLPEVPFMTSFLKVSGCVSLDISSVQKRFWGLFTNLVCVFAVNCPNLHRCTRATAFSVLKDYLVLYISFHRSRNPNFSITPYRRRLFHVAAPGNEIPESFHQKEGSSIIIHRHPDVYNNSKLVGYVMCCVFVVNKHPPWEDDCIPLSYGDRHRIRFYSSSVDKHICEVVPAVSFEAEKSGQAMSDQTWLIFFSRRECKEICNPIKGSFRVVRGAGLEVKRCGARPIYEKEVEDLFNESSNSAFSNLNIFPYEDFVESTMDNQSESTDLERSVSSSCDLETRAAAIDDLFGHLNQPASELKDFVGRSTTDVIVNINQSIVRNKEAESSASNRCEEETKFAVNKFLNTLVPEIKDFVRSTTKRGRDEAESGENSCCDNDEPQAKRTKVEISIVGKRPGIESYGFVL